jgi:prepilin peptidase CpaA
LLIKRGYLGVDCLNLVTLILVLLLIGIATITDINERRIPNWLTFSAIIAGMLLHLIADGIPGGLFAVKGMALGLVILLPAFIWGGLGAGDVKLLAAIGALMGPQLVLNAGIYSILFGGAISLVLLIWHRRFLITVKRIWNYLVYLSTKVLVFKQFSGEKPTIHEPGKEITFPFGVAISLGTIVAIVVGM